MDDHRQSRVKATWLICLTGLVGLAGCIGLGRGAPPPQHYVLGGGPWQVDTPSAGDLAGVSVGLRRPQVASYLDAPFIVVRRGSHQVAFSAFHRWGEHLGSGINRAVAGHLSERGSFDRVDVAPWTPRDRYDYLIQLHVVRFEGLMSGEGEPVEGEAHIVVRWEIIRHADGEVLAREVTDHRESGWRAGDYAGLVTLLNAGLGVLSDDLVAAIRELAPLRPELRGERPPPAS